MLERLVLPEGVREWMQADIDPDILPEAERERDLAFLHGERGLTMDQILDLADRTRVPNVYFLLSSPPKSP